MVIRRRDFRGEVRRRLRREVRFRGEPRLLLREVRFRGARLFVLRDLLVLTIYLKPVSRDLR